MARISNARLFGAGVAPTGEPAELIVEGDHLDVHARDRLLSSSIAELRLREIGFGREMGLELAWEDAQGAHAVHVVEREAVSTLRSLPAIAALPEMQALSKAVRRRSIGRSIGWTLIATFLLLPLILILVLIAQADRIAAIAISRIPIEQEMRLGQSAFEGMRASLSLQESGPAYEAVQQLGARLSEGSSYRYRFHVARNEAINAFAMPGGIIVVYDGLIAATRRPEELAGVLAHEIQHVEQRHSLRAAFKELGLRGAWMLLTGDVGGTMIGQAALELTSRKFSRDDESSADAHAFDALVKHGIDPTGMVDFFTTMAQENRTKLPELLSTHPADAVRQRTLQERAAQIANKSFAPLDLGPWPPGGL